MVSSQNQLLLCYRAQGLLCEAVSVLRLMIRSVAVSVLYMQHDSLDQGLVCNERPGCSTLDSFPHLHAIWNLCLLSPTWQRYTMGAGAGTMVQSLLVLSL